MRAVGEERRRPEPRTRGAGLADEDEVAVRLEQVDHRVAERAQPFDRRRPRAQRRLAADECLLELLRVLVEQRQGEACAIAEAAKDRSLPDTGLLGDHVHRDALDSVPRDQPLGGLEDLQAVPGRIGPFRRWSRRLAVGARP